MMKEKEVMEWFLKQEMNDKGLRWVLGCRDLIHSAGVQPKPALHSQSST